MRRLLPRLLALAPVLAASVDASEGTLDRMRSAIRDDRSSGGSSSSSSSSHHHDHAACADDDDDGFLAWLFGWGRDDCAHGSSHASSAGTLPLIDASQPVDWHVELAADAARDIDDAVTRVDLRTRVQGGGGVGLRAGYTVLAEPAADDRLHLLDVEFVPFAGERPRFAWWTGIGGRWQLERGGSPGGIALVGGLRWMPWTHVGVQTEMVLGTLGGAGAVDWSADLVLRAAPLDLTAGWRSLNVGGVLVAGPAVGMAVRF